MSILEILILAFIVLVGFIYIVLYIIKLFKDKNNPCLAGRQACLNCPYAKNCKKIKIEVK